MGKVGANPLTAFFELNRGIELNQFSMPASERRGISPAIQPIKCSSKTLLEGRFRGRAAEKQDGETIGALLGQIMRTDQTETQ